jgi:hypothetical protein
MSGPTPVLAATEAFGWMSSNASLVTFDLDARRLGEGVDHFQEGVFFLLQEALPAHQLDGGVRFRLPLRGLRPGLGEIEQAGAGCGAGGALHQRAAGDDRHAFPPVATLVVRPRRFACPRFGRQDVSQRQVSSR